MKIMTVSQPYAQLLAAGKKHDETRSWPTDYRGEILIYATMKEPKISRVAMKSALRSLRCRKLYNRFVNFPTKAIIGTAVLTDCKLIDQAYHDFTEWLCPEEYLYGDFTIGGYAWRLEKPRLFKNPIPASGRLGLGDFGEDVQICRRVRPPRRRKNLWKHPRRPWIGLPGDLGYRPSLGY